MFDLETRRAERGTFTTFGELKDGSMIHNRAIASDEVPSSNAPPFRMVFNGSADKDSTHEVTPFVQHEVNTYEREVIRKIAAWKTKRTAPLRNVFDRLTRPVGWGLNRVLPASAINAAISAACSTSQWLAEVHGSIRHPGLSHATDRRGQSLELCDRLAARVGRVAQTAALINGAVTGMAGFLFVPVDVGTLTIVALSAIHRTGQCYGFSLDQASDRPYVRAILMLAGTDTLRERQELFAHLEDFRGWVLARTIEAIAIESLTRRFMQLAVLESIPGIGVALGAAFNVAFIRRVLTDCQRVFQHRWLLENGRIPVATGASAVVADAKIPA
jgi:hypothetical protein